MSSSINSAGNSPYYLCLCDKPNETKIAYIKQTKNELEKIPSSKPIRGSIAMFNQVIEGSLSESKEIHEVFICAQVARSRFNIC